MTSQTAVPDNEFSPSMEHVGPAPVSASRGWNPLGQTMVKSFDQHLKVSEEVFLNGVSGKPRGSYGMSYSKVQRHLGSSRNYAMKPQTY